MEFRILGPLEVLERGHQVALGGAKQRALLTTLLLQANEVVSTDRLVDALWEEEPPAQAAKALQVYISQLRKALGRDRLETRKPGYVLRVGDEELDVVRFERLLEEGRPSEALALWRGQPLSDVAYSRFARAEIGRLEELRVSALEERIEQDLAAGRHAALVAELEALVAEHPLRERLRGQLMRALYRSGRQAEALEAYQDARRALTEELGIEPGRELRELQQAILSQDPALDLTEEEPVAAEATPASQPPPERPTREVRKTVTVLVSDLSPTVDGLDTEALRRMASRCFEELKSIFERHGAAVEQSIGGTVTGVFGIPVIHEDDALRALRASAEARERIADLGDELESSWGARVTIRTGVGTGEVVTGGEGHAIGGPVHAAAELQQAAGWGDVLLDDSTLRLARDAVDVERVDEQIRLVAVRPAVLAQRGRLRSPMVGRERERRRLHAAFEQAVGDRSCQSFTVLGLAGVGKSRLVDEFLGDVAGAALVTQGRCLPYGEGITYWPVVEAVKELASLDDADSPEEAKTKLVDALRDDPDAALIAERVAELIGVSESGLRTEDGFAAVQALLEALARAQPLVVVFDDIHWGESTFLDLIEYLADWTREAPVLLVCLARPELLDIRPGWGGGKLNSTSILLEPLSEAESVELIENLAGGDLEEAARQRIVEGAEGNPLFVEEMLALVLEEDEPTADLVVPPTIQALLAARLDRLGGDDRAVIERAAVQGKVFNEDAVAELSPDELPAAVSTSLRSLLHKELIRPERPSLGGRTYRFRHLLIRDAAYESIPKGVRAELHERFGRWLERATGSEYDEIVGYHLEQAYRYRADLGPVDDSVRAVAREAAERLGAAGRRAFARSDPPAATNLILRAVSLLDTDDPLRVDLIPNVRSVQGWRTDLEWAETVLEDAIAVGDPRLTAHAYVQQGFLRLFTAAAAQPEELIRIAEETIRVFEKLDDELGLARAWRLIAQAQYLARRAGPSTEASQRALEHARRAEDRFEQREIVEWLAVTLALGPTPAPEAARECEQLLNELPEDSILEAIVLGALWYLTAIQEPPAEALTLGERGRRRVHDVREELIWLFPASLGWIALWCSEPSTAEHDLRPVYDQLRNIGEKSHFSSVAAVLAQSVYAQGRYDEAEELALEAKGASRPNDVHSQIIWRGTRAKVLAKRGEFEAAEQLAREAVAFAEQSDFLHSHADARADLAEVLLLAGRREEAAEAIRAAIALHEQKQNALGASRARAMLEGLVN